MNMSSQRKLLTGLGLSVLVVLLCAALPNTAHATGVGFYNNTKSRILVQGHSIVKGMIRKGPVLVVYPGKTVYDIYVPVGPRTITIADGLNPNQILYNNVMPIGPVDVLFVVQPLPNGTLQLVPKMGP